MCTACCGVSTYTMVKKSRADDYQKNLNILDKTSKNVASISHELAQACSSLDLYKQSMIVFTGKIKQVATMLRSTKKELSSVKQELADTKQELRETMEVKEVLEKRIYRMEQIYEGKHKAPSHQSRCQIF